MRVWAAMTALALLGAAPVPGADAVATAARAALARTGARGLAVAVIAGGQVRSVQAFGQRNLKGDPLTPDTVMYGASLTKAVFAYLVLQLVDEGRLDLDRPLATYLPRPLPDYGNLPNRQGNWGDLAGDARWRRITARHVLTHSTGFANFAWLEPDGRLAIHFDPGARYAYSGEGMLLLQFVLEQGLGLDVAAEARRRIFGPFGMTRTDLVWQDAWTGNMASGWDAAGVAAGHRPNSRVRAAGSMDTTPADMARFAAAMVRGEGLSRRMRRTLAQGTLPITTAAQFPTLAPELPPGQRMRNVAAAAGVVAFSGPQGRGFYKGGHDDRTGNSLVCLERGRRCVLLMANDVRAEAAFPALVRTVLGETGVPYRWEYPDIR
jgi:CubicO group peptidase (beta-lactamase class C family)